MSTEENYSRIPAAPFSETISGLLTALNDVLNIKTDINNPTDETLQQMDALLSRYRLMESSLGTKYARIKATQSDLETSRSAIELLKSNKGATNITYELGDTLYGKAVVEESATRKVGLLLGAGVILEYEASEAISLLREKLDTQSEEMRKCENDIDFVRRQITTMEVGIARIYNHIVQLSRKKLP